MGGSRCNGGILCHHEQGDRAVTSPPYGSAQLGLRQVSELAVGVGKCVNLSWIVSFCATYYAAWKTVRWLLTGGVQSATFQSFPVLSNVSVLGAAVDY